MNPSARNSATGGMRVRSVTGRRAPGQCRACPRSSIRASRSGRLRRDTRAASRTSSVSRGARQVVRAEQRDPPDLLAAPLENALGIVHHHPVLEHEVDMLPLRPDAAEIGPPMAVGNPVADHPPSRTDGLKRIGHGAPDDPAQRLQGGAAGLRQWRDELLDRELIHECDGRLATCHVLSCFERGYPRQETR